MSARIEVSAGPQAGTVHWITRPVLRLGCDPQMDLPLDGVAGHAVTLQFRGGQYLVFRRDESCVQLGGAAVDDGQPRPWRDGEVLQLGDHARLRLKIEGEPAPAPAPREPAAWGAASALPARSPRPSGQTVLLGGLVVLLSAYVFLVPGQDAASREGTNAEFERLIEDLLEYAPPEDIRLQTLRPQLQTAYGLESRGCREEAAGYYQRMRTLLQRPRHQHDRFAGLADIRAMERRLTGFVVQRLQQLSAN